MADRRQARAQLANLVMLYGIEREQPDARDALAELRELAIDQVNRLRTASRSRTGRLEAVEFIDERFLALLDDTLNQVADPATVFAMIESLRARTLLDQMHAEPAKPLPPQTAARIDAIERQIMKFNPADDAVDGVMRNLQLASQLQIAAPDRIDEVEQLLEECDGGFAGGAGVASLAEVMGALREDEVLIEYCMPARSMGAARLPLAIWAMIVTRQSATVTQLVRFPPPTSHESRLAVDGEAAVDFSPITALISSLVAGVRTNAGDADSKLQAAYRMLVTPLLAAGIDPSIHRHWIIVPDAALHAMPFAALCDAEGNFLGTRVAMTVVPSASTWYRQQQSAPPLRSFLGFGNPQVPGMITLPYAEAELREACRLLRNRGLDCRAYVQAQATESTFKEMATGRSILHIAAHGAIATADAFDFHGLMLGGSAAEDGRLQAHEVRSLDLHETAIAVLSVCDSGTYRFGAGNELHGLVASLMIAGVHDVVGTLWPINDAVASRLIVRFYTYLVQHGAAEALRRARVDMIRQGARVRDWAAFMVIGHGRRSAAEVAQ